MNAHISFFKNIFRHPLTWIMFLATVIRLYRYDVQSVWLDEAVSIHFAQLPLQDLLAIVDPTPWLFYILLHFWAKIGTTTAILKLLTILFSIGSVVGVYLVAQALFSKKIALISSLFWAVSPTSVFYAQELRAYSLLFMLSAFVMYAYAKYATHRNYKVIYGLLFIALVYTHLYALFVLAAIQIHKFLQKPRQFFLDLQWIILHSLYVACSIPWFLRIAENIAQKQAGWILTPALADLLYLFLNCVSGPTGFTFGFIATGIMLLLILYGIAYQVILKKKKTTNANKDNASRVHTKEHHVHSDSDTSLASSRNLLYLWIICPVFIPFVASFFVQPFYFYRYALLITIPVFILGAVSIDTMKSRRMQISFITILSLLLLITCILQAHNVTKTDWKNVVVSRPVAFIAYYESFPYIYHHEPGCFAQKNIDEIYGCAKKKDIIPVFTTADLNESIQYNFVLSKEWLTKEDTFLANELVPKNAIRHTYSTNSDIGFLRNYIPGENTTVVLVR